MLQEAARQEADGDIDAAIRDYTLLVEHFPATPQGGEALFRLAWIHWNGGEVERAEEAARRVSLEHQGAAWGAGGLFILGEVQASRAHDLESLDEARASFRNVWVFYPREALPEIDWRSRARVRYGEISLQQGADAAAAEAFVDALEDERVSEWTPRAALGLATVLTDRDRWREAAETLQEVLSDPRAGTSPALLRRLTLIHRLEVRPLSGQARWQRSRAITGARLRLDRPPAGIAAAEDGRLAVVDANGSAVTILEIDGTPRRHELRSPHGRPSWDRRGAAHLALDEGRVATLGGRRIALHEPDKPEQELKELGAVERGVFGWWVVSAKRALRFGFEGGFAGAISEAPEQRPADLAQDQRGRIYVLDQKNRSVTRLAADGGSRQVVATGPWSRPEAIAVDALGNLYVLDPKSRTIEVLEPNGKRLETLGPMLPGGVELKAPRDVAVDGEGRLFVTDVKLAQVVVLE
jgi:TolA-binding protein/DNA-binding beta-propeller fold protein YncE